MLGKGKADKAAKELEAMTQDELRAEEARLEGELARVPARLQELGARPPEATPERIAEVQAELERQRAIFERCRKHEDWLRLNGVGFLMSIDALERELARLKGNPMPERTPAERRAWIAMLKIECNAFG